MKEKDHFLSIRRQKNRLDLTTRFMLVVSFVVVISLVVAFILAYLVLALLPGLENIPQTIQIGCLCLVTALIIARLCASMFFDPITALRDGMQQVADGDLRVHLTVKTTSKEMQEVIAGFNMMVQELRSTEILQTDFVSNVSHEFKTPINAIEGYTTLLQGTEHIDEVENAYIEKILFNTHRLSSLVSNILLLSKIENQSIQTDRQRYALDEQIREVIVAAESDWAPKDIDFDIDLESVTYYGSESLMFHVWSNLLGNAIKFSPQGGAIRLRLLRADDNILFFVEDRGPGLSEEGLKHIFDKFYQEDTSHREEGNGLGLALVKNILANTGGAVTAENVPEGGCRFTVTLKNGL